MPNTDKKYKLLLFDCIDGNGLIIYHSFIHLSFVCSSCLYLYSFIHSFIHLFYSLEIPNLVKNAKIAHCSYDAAEIKWDKDEHSKSYSIEVAKADSMLRYYETVSNDITIRKLDNNTVYNFTIHARNNFGHGMDTTLSCKTARMGKPNIRDL